MSDTYVIAEAGVNHNGDVDLAFKLVDAAKEAGADAVKFQTFLASKLVTKAAPKAQYQNLSTDASESQHAMLSRLELPHNAYLDLLDYCKLKEIEFLSTAFDYESLIFLRDRLKVKTLKISSGDLTNAPLVLEHAKTGFDIILSTGMATLEEIQTALGVIAYGYIHQKNVCHINKDLFADAFQSEEGQKLLKEKVCLLHCTTEYPAPLREINLRAMDTMIEAFGLKVGYSDHSEGILVSLAAVAKGARIIEKHFTLDREMEGPDHAASLEPGELKELVDCVREIDLAQGKPHKLPSLSEESNKLIARKSLVAAMDIKKGQKITADYLTCKRPGSGISPLRYWDYLGTVAKKDYKEDDLL